MNQDIVPYNWCRCEQGQTTDGIPDTTLVWRYLRVVPQVKDVYQRDDGWPAVGTLEGQLTTRQGGHQAATLVLTEAVVEFDCTCLGHNTKPWHQNS